MEHFVLCSRCRKDEARPGQRYCRWCHAAYQRAHRKQPTCRKYNELSPLERAKMRARKITTTDVRRGHIERGPCVDCGAPKESTEVHHLRYPDLFVWVCKTCHAARERAIRASGIPTPVVEYEFLNEHILEAEWKDMLARGLVVKWDGTERR